MNIEHGHRLFEAFEKGFEHAPYKGVVQFTSEDQKEQFYVTVEDSDLHFTEGAAESPESIVTVHEGAIQNMLAKATTYDPRVIEFSSTMTFTGNTELSNFLCNLVMRPTVETLDKLALVKETTLNSTKLSSVPTLHKPTPEEVMSSLRAYRPLVITGILDEWQVSKWNMESLEEHFGKYQLVSYLPWTVQNYTQEGAEKYSGGTGLPGVLAGEFKTPAFLNTIADLGFPQRWLGSSAKPEQKPVTNLHCDCVHGNFLCQVFGRKKVVFYPPYEEEYLYPYRAFNQYRDSWVNPSEVDFEKYPLFKNATPIEVILNPGDTLLVPFGWYHCVYALDPVMSISYPVWTI
ncbi:MAG: cupin-like domain-containing protein [Kangiellaceae bacterium]|nr:cupin-like domain-containing protein [Kangiellaceae bacterium]